MDVSNVDTEGSGYKISFSTHVSSPAAKYICGFEKRESGQMTARGLVGMRKALVTSARLPPNFSVARLKSSRGRKDVRPAAVKRGTVSTSYFQHLTENRAKI